LADPDSVDIFVDMLLGNAMQLTVFLAQDSCKWAHITYAVRIQWRMDSLSGAVWWFPWIVTCVPLIRLCGTHCA